MELRKEVGNWVLICEGWLSGTRYASVNRISAGHLAAEFHVSLRTIYYDLEYLSLIYPLEVIRGRYHGGIKIADYFTPDKTKLTPVQRDLLLRLCTNLYGNDKLIMLSILDTFT